MRNLEKDFSLVSGSLKEETKKLMGTDTGRGSRKGAVRKRSQRQTKMMGKKRWTKRSKASGKFMSQKKAGAKKYKGVRGEA
jgi:hypothetical protein